MGEAAVDPLLPSTATAAAAAGDVDDIDRHNGSGTSMKDTTGVCDIPGDMLICVSCLLYTTGCTTTAVRHRSSFREHSKLLPG